MQQLPVEVLQQIFYFLHQQEKVECMQTCRHWADIIQTFNLFNTVHLSKMASLGSFTEKYQQQEEASRVERLILDLDLDKKFDMNLIMTLFPHLRVLFLRRAKQPAPITTIINTSQSLKTSCIEHLAEAKSYVLTHNILSTHLCPYLKTLSVNACDDSNKKLIPLLANAPNLRKLSITALRISFNDLESLHTSLPLLDSIQFFYAKFLNDDDFMPRNIQPATFVTQFALEAGRASAETQTEWLRYIHKKYPNLTDWEFRCLNDRLDREENVENVNKEGLIPLLQGFGPQLKRLSTVSRNYGPDFFTSLDSTGCQIQNLSLSMGLQPSLLDAFVTSSQVRYIQLLKIQVVQVGNFEWLKDLPVLKELVLDYKFRFDVDRKAVKETIQLNRLLDVCPDTMEALRIMHACINIDHTDSYTKSSCNIKKLGFFSIPLPDHMDHFISNYFPKLQTLVLEFCGLQRKTFNLEGHHLSFVRIAEGVIFKDTHLLMITNKSRQWYTAKQCLFNYIDLKDHFCIRDTQIYHTATKTLLASDTASDTTEPTLTFKCASIRTLLLLGY
ncbi:hypothetical protein K501DRAFT_310935 [Backusella circina FSU 941]|nr:hypothetical protein K501DRAFT_310935 [Backusella circina FSU 941]